MTNNIIWGLLGVIIGMAFMYYLVYRFPLEFVRISNTIGKAKIRNSENIDILQTNTKELPVQSETRIESKESRRVISWIKRIFKKNEIKSEEQEILTDTQKQSN